MGNVREVFASGKQLSYDLLDETIIHEALELEAQLDREEIPKEQTMVLRRRAKFTIDADSVRLLEVYPPNKLFKTK